MSRSIHITTKNFNGLTKKETDEQLEDTNSELRQWGKKSLLKYEIKKNVKTKRNQANDN